MTWCESDSRLWCWRDFLGLQGDGSYSEEISLGVHWRTAEAQYNYNVKELTRLILGRLRQGRQKMRWLNRDFDRHGELWEVGDETEIACNSWGHKNSDTEYRLN